MNPLQFIIETLDSITMATLGLRFSLGNFVVLAAFFGFGWLFGKLTRRVGIIKAFFALIIGAYFYDLLVNAHFAIVWAFLLGVLANHGYLFLGALSWARDLSDIVFALRYRRAFEDIRRREEELAEREREFARRARAEARTQAESTQQRQWREQAQARRSGAPRNNTNEQSARESGAHQKQTSHQNSSSGSGGSTRNGLRAQYLRTMGLDPHGNYSASELKRAYRTRAKKTHPDTGGSSGAFQEMNGAYEWLVAN